MALSKRARVRPFAAWVLFLVSVVGCGGKPIYPVRGQIVDADGNPVTKMEGGAVEFASVDGKTSANGSIDGEGRFRLSTEGPGDGAHVGKNRVAIVRPYYGADQPSPHVIHPKYENMDTSELEVMVEPKENDVKLVVELFKGRPR